MTLFNNFTKCRKSIFDVSNLSKTMSKVISRYDFVALSISYDLVPEATLLLFPLIFFQNASLDPYFNRKNVT